MSDKLIFNCAWGRDEPERATLPFVAANIAAVAGQEAIVLCTIEAVHLGTVNGTDGIEAPGLPKLCDLFAEFVLEQSGGQIDGNANVVVYASVANINAILSKIEEQGGRTVMPRTDVGPVIMALYVDPEGNTMGLVEG